MIHKKTVLVLGAGASVPFGFPTGHGLKDKICNLVGGRAIHQELAMLGFRAEVIKAFRQALIRSPVPSVDAFLERRTEFEDVGKAAIAAALLPCEKTDYLFDHWIQKRSDPHNKEGNWYDQVFEALNTQFDKLTENRLSIITFNYDRSLEHYLFTALRNTYGQTEEESAEKLSAIDIIHVHGSLGLLNWQVSDGDPIGYDSEANAKIIKRAMGNIKIIHEDVTETDEFNKARELLKKAERLYFLGFGYHPMNLKRLDVESLNRREGQDIRGTSHGLSIEVRAAVNRLNYQRGSTTGRIFYRLHDCTVWEFFHEHVSLRDI